MRMMKHRGVSLTKLRQAAVSKLKKTFSITGKLKQLSKKAKLSWPWFFPPISIITCSILTKRKYKLLPMQPIPIQRIYLPIILLQSLPAYQQGIWLQNNSPPPYSKIPEIRMLYNPELKGRNQLCSRYYGFDTDAGLRFDDLCIDCKRERNRNHGSVIGYPAQSGFRNYFQGNPIFCYIII